MTTFNGIHPFPAPPYLYHGGSHSAAMDSTVHSLIYKIHETEKSESETPCSQKSTKTIQTYIQKCNMQLQTKHKQQGEETKIEIKHVQVELAVHYCLSCKTIINHLLCKY